MFGLSTKEVLSKAIINACYNCKKTYKSAIIENIDKLNNCDEESADDLLTSIRREYLNEVADSVINTFRVSSTAISSRIQLAFMSPQVCGYDIKFENGIMAGSVFAICYYAIKNKIAPANLCIRLNHIQNDIIDEVLQEIEKGQ
ncbi:MAG: hypothetical protein IJB80_03640 [Clostridia bacterium]|nr:hypothetical protein [Clostridia bacterium]